MGYDIECHIGSDISNNGRWRKDSGFDVQIQAALTAIKHIVQGVPFKLGNTRSFYITGGKYCYIIVDIMQEHMVYH